ncbi:hypothetical protein ASF17_03115 [Frigoribacterium sp. Leaf263]|uniref:sugar ABC transporter ATP-binding protein n=1 Tax=Frigoribacterium sp. Leaf263 TaxID=1736313 RepID=UPI0006F34B15|nr:sugar ABC transporter ATP-binding protein [Frigoribacterium sp. Leaf263]KQO84495.1 hypothetical protein ASF17_03115 [Frigoribacterium sp. Leaf263]
MTSPVLQARDIRLSYPGSLAVKGVDISLLPGEVHALIGENGAGKSTVAAVLGGLIRPDSGVLLLDDEPVRFSGPADALRAGIGMVHQDPAVLPNLTVAENISLTTDRTPWVSRRRSRADVDAALAAISCDLDPATLVEHLSPSRRQLVAVARAVHASARVVILDEPTSSLGADEVTDLFGAIRALTDRGVAVLFVSHFLDQVYEIADRLTVLRDGHLVGCWETSDVLAAGAVADVMGAGHPDSASTDPTRPDLDDVGPTVLHARGVVSDRLPDALTLSVHAGQVTGLSGLRGSGRTTAARLLGGVDPVSEGSVTTSGGALVRAPRDALANGVVYLTEDRRRDGIVGALTVQENILISVRADQGWWRRMSAARARELALSWMESLDIKPLDPDARADTLSGGNQQKVMLARALATAPRVLLLDEPTRGVDVGGRFTIQQIVRELAADGMSVVYSSADIDEVRRVSDRILVFRDRRLVGDLAAEQVTSRTLLTLMS